MEIAGVDLDYRAVMTSFKSSSFLFVNLLRAIYLYWNGQLIVIHYILSVEDDKSDASFSCWNVQISFDQL